MLKNIRKGLIRGGVRNSAVASQPCPAVHITRAIRLLYALPKVLLPQNLRIARKRYMKWSGDCNE